MKNQASPAYSTQSGSVIIWIMIMVALFAALSLALSRGTRTSQTDLTGQQTKIAATEILTYMNQVKDGFKTLTVNGCDPLKVDFNTSLYTRVSGTDMNASSPGTTSACGMYTADGANIRPIVFSEYASPSYVPTATSPNNMHFYARYADMLTGSTQNDLVYAATGMKEAICVALLNLTSTTVYAKIAQDTVGYAATNSYSQGAPGDAAPALALPPASFVFAIKATSADDYCTFGIVLRAN